MAAAGSGYARAALCACCSADRNFHSGNGSAKWGIGIIVGKYPLSGRDHRYPGCLADKKRAVDHRSGNGVFLDAYLADVGNFFTLANQTAIKRNTNPIPSNKMKRLRVLSIGEG